MATRQKVYGGGETTATITGEPDPAQSSGQVTVFGGAPSLTGALSKGENQVGRDGGDVMPDTYGGGESIVDRPSPFPTRGGGDSTNTSTPSSTSIP